MKNYLLKSAVLISLSLLISVFCFAQSVELDPRAGKRKVDPNSKPVIFMLAANGEILLGSEKISAAKVTDKVSRLMETRPLDQEIVYVVAGADKNYGDIADFMRLARRAQVEHFGFFVQEEAEREVAKAVSVKVVPEFAKGGSPKPAPLSLIVELNADRQVSLNSKPLTLDDLAAELRQTFNRRKQNGVFRAGTREVEKTVFVKAAPSAKFGEVIKVIRTVKSAGAYPIGLDIDTTSKF